jgi:hypothetical protein
MCIYCYTFIQLDDYWIKKFGLAINKKNYISMDNWSQLVHQLVDRENFTIKDMNNLMKDLHLDTEVSLIDEDGINEKKWIQIYEKNELVVRDFISFLKSRMHSSHDEAESTTEATLKPNLHQTFQWKSKNYEVLSQLLNTLALSESQAELVLLGVRHKFLNRFSFPFSDCSAGPIRAYAVNSV